MAMFALTACNSVPVSGLEKTFTLAVDQTQGTGDPVKIDFLWVIDNTASMCEEQVGLADNFETFTGVLVEQFELDARVAVATTDMHCDPQNPQVYASMGQFSRRPATSFPPGCQKKVREPCTVDADCENLDCYLYGQCGEDQGLWTCSEVNLAKCMVNPNGSVNTDCKRRCTSDEECQTLFGDDRYICQKPSGNRGDWGCMLPPFTDGCPEELPPILTSETLDLFPCLATVGVNQMKCYAYEQGLASAYAALDQTSANYMTSAIECSAEQPCPQYGGDAWDQAQAADKRLGSLQHLECIEGLCRGPNYGFLRDDAYLVIVFVSDEEDCSAKTQIGEDYHDQCGVLDLVDKGTAKGGPLVAVSDYVNLYKAVKGDPTRVMVAAIAGDAIPPTPEDIAANVAPACSTCAVSGAPCEVSWVPELDCTDGTCGDTIFPCTIDLNDDGQLPNPNKPNYSSDCSKRYQHVCDEMACTAGTCGDTAVGCSTDDDCNTANTCQGEDGETLGFTVSNEQNPLCNCLAAPKSFNVEDYDDADPSVALDKQMAFANALIACQQEQFVDSKSNPFDCHNTTYVCESSAGIADWGTRYFELAQRFGPNGISTNICDASGIGPALEEIAEIIINIVNKICLPKQLKNLDSLVVTKTVVDDDGALVLDEATGQPMKVTLTQADEGENTYVLVPGGEDCKIDGDEYQAIKFNNAPETGETVFISFDGDPQLSL